jgi:2'-5' RNA ligase
VEKHSFSSTQFNLPDELATHVKKAGAAIPDWALGDGGRETEPHVTVKYGLHGTDPEPVRKVVADHPPFKVALGKTSHFPDSGDGDVVKADVTSPDLHRLHHKIADALPHTDTHPGYKPHVTLAYVKKGLGPFFSGDNSLEGKTATVNHITFSSKDGKKTKLPLSGKPLPSTRRYRPQ